MEMQVDINAQAAMQEAQAHLQIVSLRAAEFRGMAETLAQENAELKTRIAELEKTKE